MTWRGSTTVKDRIFASLPYLFPLIGALGFGFSLLQQFPVLALLFVPLEPVLVLYGVLGPYGELIIFFALFLLVVRNERISHFIRFNTLQALLLNIIVYLCGILVRVVGLAGITFALQTVASTVFIGIVAAVVYSVIQSLWGRYAEIPAISNAVYTQLPR